NMPFGFDLDGPLDAEALRSSLLDVVERHEILRSTFHAGADGPEQRVGEARLPWSLIDLASTPPAERADEADRIEARFVDEPFDLDTGPILRALLLRLGDDLGGDLREATVPRHRLLLVVHHIAFDGYSLDILLRELGILYRRRLAADVDDEPLLAALPAQVADHAVGQRRQWPESRLAASLDARLERLAGVSPLELPLDRPRVVGGARPIGIGRWIWPEAVIDGLEAYARARGTTVFTVLLAGFEALLGRISGQDDFALALAVASRERADVQDSIGFFVETLLSRARLDGDPSFDDLVERVRADVLDALAHQQLPLDRQLDGVDPSRRAGDDALTRVLFVQQGEVPRPIELAPGVVARAEELVSSEAKFDLLVSAARTDEGLRLDVEWDAALFDRTTVRRWFAAYGRMLAAVAEKGLVGDVADQRISRLPIDDRALRHLESIEWNDTATAFPADHTLSQLFAEVVTHHADAEAVRDDGLSLSYAELASRSRRLARVLRRHGVGFDDRVGVLLERSADLLVALLAVIEAGAAYVPLDPSHPADRLAFMLDDSGARLLLTGANAPRPTSSSTASWPVLELDDPTIVAAVEAEADGPLEPWPAAGPDQLAYLIYTSGSTGRPKGVAVPQRGVVRLVRESDYVRFRPGDRVAQVSNASFDVATFDIWGAWLNGGVSVVIRTDVLLDADRLAARLAAERIDVMFLTAALFHQTALRRPEAFGGVRDLLAGGEAVDPRGARAVLRSASPPRRLINGYGPTECTTFGTSWRIDQVAEQARSVPIGRPIGATVAHVVGADLSPVPLGGVGELLLGGPGLARGYHGRPARTATSFVPDPFGAEPGGRLYRTGDVVRRLADGSIDFLGRRDHQVKLRGFRIELGEIESVLEAHPALTERLVMVREDRPGDRRLVAYVARRLDDAPDPVAFVEALRALAADHLPDYMVPTLVVLDALPLTPNGKVDRRALPSPEPSIGTGAEPVEPSTETESVLAPIFAELLGLDEISIVDDFFALGGHSLLAARLVAHVEQRFEVELPLDAIFHAPTVAQLAARLDAVLSADPEQDDALSADPPIGPAPLSFGQSRLWFLERLDAGSTRYHMPFLFDFDGPLDAAALRAALLDVVERHEVLRTTYHDGVDGPEQRVGAARLPWSTVDLTELPAAERDDEAERSALACAREPFDLEAGPMLRALLLRRTAEPPTHRLVLVIHHIAFDGHSLDVLVGELRTLYGQRLDGVEPVLAELPDLPVQVADHARAQRRDWTEERLAASLEARLARLAGVPPLDLPADRARDPQSTRPAGTWRGRWPSAVADGLEAYARGRGSTLFMVLLAGFETLLGRVSGQDDFAIAIATAGRERAGIRHVIGFFVETLLSRAELAGDPSFDRLLDRVRADVLDAFAHQSVPLDRQLDGVDPGRRAGDDTLARVVFVHQGEASRPREMAPGLVLRTSGWTSEAAKFELLV
ncbi:MAG: amino acid adenylation domain-containing protein, partial [Acidobacteriota bacterium]